MKTLIAIGFLSFGMLWSRGAEAQATAPLSTLDCASPAIVGPGCLLTLAPGFELGAVRAESVSDQVTRPTVFTPLYELGPNDVRSRSQAIILIDDSTNAGAPPGARRRTLAPIRTAVASLAEALPSDVEIAVLVYDQEVRSVLPFGADDAAISAAADNLAFDGRTTRTFAALNRAVEALAARPALTRSIYLFTDGIAEDAASRTEVIAAAKRAGVAISTLVVHWLREGRPERGEAETIFSLAADETGGVFGVSEASDAGETGRRFLSDIESQRRGGGVIRVNGTVGDARVEVDIVRPGVGARREVATLAATLAGDPPPLPEPVPALPPVSFWRETWFAPAAVVSGALLIAAIALVIRRMRRRPEPIEEDEGDLSIRSDPEGVTRAVDQPALARLVVRGDGSVFNVTLPKFSIGRSEQNEFVLKDDSISRIHCEFHQTREGAFAVTDLQSLNRTLVNGEQVTTCVLADGDVIRLGEVELEFRLPGR